MRITLCDKVLIGDIPEYNIKVKKEAQDLILHWLENKDYDNNVYVCFLSWRGVDYRDENSTILISHSEDDIIDWVLSNFEYENWKDLNLNIFEFESYQEATKYIIDLKEGC